MGKQKNWKKMLKDPRLVAAIVGALVGALSAFAFQLGRDYYEWQVLLSDERMIREVIEREAVLVLDGQIDEVVLLFDEEAFVRDAAGDNKDLETIWNGKNEIAERYRNLQEFTYLKHEAIEITIGLDRTYARAIADTIGTYRVNGTEMKLSSNQGEKWTFEKTHGRWKITGFTYNLP